MIVQIICDKEVGNEDIVKAYEKVNNITIPYVIAPRRAGDLPEYYADSSKANRELNWHTTKDLEDMCRDCYRFVVNCSKEQ